MEEKKEELKDATISPSRIPEWNPNIKKVSFYKKLEVKKAGFSDGVEVTMSKEEALELISRISNQVLHKGYANFTLLGDLKISVEIPKNIRQL